MKTFASIIILLIVTLIHAQNTPKFPEAYIGKWKGNLEIYNAKGDVAQRVPMELNIAATADGKRYVWKTIYNNTDIRDYELVVLDAEKGRYSIDEKNGIVLDLRLFGNKGFTCFEVDGYLISNSYTFSNDNIIFELTSSVPKQVSKSGKGTEESPAVTSYPQAAYQKAVLKKQP